MASNTGQSRCGSWFSGGITRQRTYRARARTWTPGWCTSRWFDRWVYVWPRIFCLACMCIHGVCVYIYMHVCLCIYVCIMHIHVYTYVCMNEWMYTCIDPQNEYIQTQAQEYEYAHERNYAQSSKQTYLQFEVKRPMGISELHSITHIHMNKYTNAIMYNHQTKLTCNSRSGALRASQNRCWKLMQSRPSQGTCSSSLWLSPGLWKAQPTAVIYIEWSKSWLHT